MTCAALNSDAYGEMTDEVNACGGARKTAV